MSWGCVGSPKSGPTGENQPNIRTRHKTSITETQTLTHTTTVRRKREPMAKYFLPVSKVVKFPFCVSWSIWCGGKSVESFSCVIVFSTTRKPRFERLLRYCTCVDVDHLMPVFCFVIPVHVCYSFHASRAELCTYFLENGRHIIFAKKSWRNFRCTRVKTILYEANGWCIGDSRGATRASSDLPTVYFCPSLTIRYDESGERPSLRDREKAHDRQT